MNKRAIIVIPARYHSTRLPGKPLQLIDGKSMLYRLWKIAQKVNNIDRVYIATEDARIADHAKTFCDDVIMTPLHCVNGTERVLLAVETLARYPEVIINLQGDAVLTPPWVIQTLLDAMLQDKTIQFATTATRMKATDYQQLLLSKKRGQVSGTTVVFDKNHFALYFSKSMIPFVREEVSPLPVYRHIGLYAYRYQMLKKYVSLQPTLLERIEGLEPLRALENDIPIKIVEVDYQGRTHWAVDSIEDWKAEKLGIE